MNNYGNDELFPKQVLSVAVGRFLPSILSSANESQSAWFVDAFVIEIVGKVKKKTCRLVKLYKALTLGEGEKFSKNKKWFIFHQFEYASWFMQMFAKNVLIDWLIIIIVAPRSRSRSRLLPVFSVFSALGLGLGFLTLGKTEIFLHWIK